MDRWIVQFYKGTKRFFLLIRSVYVCSNNATSLKAVGQSLYILKFFDCSLKEIWIVGLPLFKKNLKGWMTRSVNRQSYVSLKILHQWRNANLIIPCSDPRDNMFREVIGKCGVLPVF